MFNREVQQVEAYRRKGQKFSEGIRRENRDEIFNKRRYQGMQNFNNESEEGSMKLKTLIVDEKLKRQILEFINTNYTDSMLPQLIRMAFSVDILEKHKGIIGIRKIISTQVQAPLQEVIDNGLVNQCINLVRQNNFPQLKLQGTWILTNIASGTAQQTKMLVEKGVVQLMVQLLHENQFGVIDQAVWALGNIAADSIKYRDKIIGLGAVEPLINIVENSQNRNLIRNGTWTITNLVRGYPSPKYQSVKGSLGLIAKVLKSQLISDKEVLSDCIWALSYLTQGAKSRVQRLLQTGILPLIFKFVKNSYSGISLPSLRIIGNFSTGNQLQTQELIDNGFFNLSYELLDFSKRGIRRQTAWILSNIAAGTPSQVQAFLDQTALLQKLLNKFLVDLAEVKRQICWIFSNFGHLGNPRKILQLYMTIDIIRYFENLLCEEEEKTIENVLQCLFKVIAVGEKAKVNNENLILKRLYTSNIVSALQKLQEHKSPKVYKAVVKIINKYFEIENPLI